MKTTCKQKEPFGVEVRDVVLGDSFLFDGRLCAFLFSDNNIQMYDGKKEIAVIDLESQEVYILPFSQKVIVVDVLPITYNVR